MKPQELTIIGAGPAGYTAAIYAARAGLQPILYQGNQPGGQLTLTTDVENYPGYPKGILGSQMMLDFQAQAQRFGTKVISQAIIAVDFHQYPYAITDSEGKKFLSQAIIIATGASAKWLGLPEEKNFYGKGVSACAVCDGFFFKNQNVGVVGGGDTAVEEALYLSKMCKNVYVFVRSHAMRASYIMQKKIKQKKNVQIFFHTSVKKMQGSQHLENVQIYDKDTDSTTNISLSGLFIAIGHQPNTNLFLPAIQVDKNGYIQTKPDSTVTNLKGVFAAGDVQDPIYRQAVTAAGSGCMAALDAERFLTQ